MIERLIFMNVILSMSEQYKGDNMARHWFLKFLTLFYERVLVKLTSVKTMLIMVNTYYFWKLSFFYVENYFKIMEMNAVNKTNIISDNSTIINIFMFIGWVYIINMLSFHSVNYLQKIGVNLGNVSGLKGIKLTQQEEPAPEKIEEK